MTNTWGGFQQTPLITPLTTRLCWLSVNVKKISKSRTKYPKGIGSSPEITGRLLITFGSKLEAPTIWNYWMITKSLLPILVIIVAATPKFTGAHFGPSKPLYNDDKRGSHRGILVMRAYLILVYTTQVNSTFRARWLASSEVISQVLFTSEQPEKNKMVFVAIFSQKSYSLGR